MNVKTGTKGFPKAELMAVVGEIKGTSEEARSRRRERRGKHAAYVKQFTVGARDVKVVAAGHNRKVPLLLVATASSLVAGNDHVKRWSTPCANGELVYHELRTSQPEMHQIYRENMNHVDLHNKLRQGVCAMADVWVTQSWTDRHFAEMIGFTEVNIFKSLKYFVPEYKDMNHSTFRRRLAWAFMTLGKAEFPDEQAARGGSSAASAGAASTTTATCGSATDLQNGPLRGSYYDMGDAEWCGVEHQMVLYSQDHTERHGCAYCGKPTRKYCGTCHSLGRG
eukprot:6205539-Pleurochrysis_carterae.AAC.1